MATNITISVDFGLDKKTVTIRKSNQSSPIIAGLLWFDLDNDGLPYKIYLRNKIHSQSESVNYEKGCLPDPVISRFYLSL